MKRLSILVLIITAVSSTQAMENFRAETSDIEKDTALACKTASITTADAIRELEAAQAKLARYNQMVEILNEQVKIVFIPKSCHRIFIRKVG